MIKLPSLLLCALLVGGCATRAPLRQPLPHVVSVGDPAFSQGIGSTLSGAFLPGNKVTMLENGDQIFSAMLQAIRGAKRSIDFETFIYYNDQISRRFTDALIERARAGVPVRVTVDAVGGHKSQGQMQELKAAGGLVEFYHPLLSINPLRANHRTHRKLLIVDGRIGFTGGVGIGDCWQGNAQDPEHWHDLHYRLEGPVVAQIQSVFMDNWLKLHREIPQGPDYFPALAPAGTSMAAAFSSSPLRSRYSAELLYHLAIAGARKSIVIENPYFVPNQELIDALNAASQRGVRVQIVMPGPHTDNKSVRRASRKKWTKLIRAGVQLFEYQPTMNHTKLLVVDDLFVSIGSTNLDPRSLRINDEANVNIIDRAFALTQAAVVARDIKKCQRAKLDDNGHLLAMPLQLVTAPVEGQL